jgi:hypothetical protein
MAILNVPGLSPEQREIWQAEQEYWDLVKRSDLEGLVALAHGRVTIWPHLVPLPVDSAHFRDRQRTRFESDPIAAYELDFHSIEVHGDAAVVYYTSITTAALPGVRPEKRRVCTTHIWIKDSGAWRLAGGMTRPAG